MRYYTKILWLMLGTIVATEGCNGCNAISPTDKELIASIQDPELKKHMHNLAKGGEGTIMPEQAISKAYDEGERGDEEKTIQVMKFLLSYLRKNKGTNKTTYDYEFILIKAMMDKRERLIIDFLLKQPDINVNSISKLGGLAPIHKAMFESSPAVVQALLARGASINMLSTAPGPWYNQGSTALHMLLGVSFGKESNTPAERKHILDILLAQPDINVNIRDVAGNTPLQCAKEHKQYINDYYRRTEPDNKLFVQAYAFLNYAEEELKKKGVKP